MKGKVILLASAAALMAVSVAPASAADWWENTSISGRMYYDLTTIDQKSNGAAQATNGVGFDIKRFYVGIDHKFNDVFSANITTDTEYSSAISSSNIYIKKAYLQAKLAPWLVIRAGSADLPWVPFAEGVYGYRYLENTLIDRTKYGTSADWGAHVLGDFGSIFSYQVSVINGNGYKNPTRADQMDFEGRLSAKYMGFVAAIGGYDGKRGAPHLTTTYHDATRFNALLAYTGYGARVGVEYFSTNDWNSVKTVATDKATGYSFFASYDFTPEWALFGRYDYVNPKTSAPTSIKDDYYNVGIQYTPYKMVNFSLAYKRDKVSGGSLSTSNGTIGGSTNGTYDEVGVWGNFQW